MRYSKSYRKAIACLIIAVVTIVYVIAAAVSLSVSSSFLGLNSVDATMTLFFVPTITGVALLLGINFWYVAEGRRSGFYRSDDNEGKRDFSII